MDRSNQDQRAPAAHYRPAPTGDLEGHALLAHLEDVGLFAGTFANKLGLRNAGTLLGLVHDLGKFSAEFQAYLASAVGLQDQDGDARVDATALRGRIDHSSAGAQFLWQVLAGPDPIQSLVAQVLALAIASHHSGLIDCLTSAPSQPVEAAFLRRMAKPDELTHLLEVLGKAPPDHLARIRTLAQAPDLRAEFQCLNASIAAHVKAEGGGKAMAFFHLGLATRFLLSALLDADRLDTARFMRPGTKPDPVGEPPWDLLIERLEGHLRTFPVHHPIDQLRREVAESCLAAASGPPGLRTLTAPTGAGKTLAQLRFALHHAKRHRLDRIIFVVPFTSIIDQNADVARQILEAGDPEPGLRVLEHHSNLAPDAPTWRAKLQAENWDAPVVFTTSVQFLEALFGSGTRSARRLHTLGRAVLVFDEIQALPVKCVHLFNSALNFLVGQSGASAVFATATQPLLHRVDRAQGALALQACHELVPDVAALFRALKRVDVCDARKPGGWSDQEVAACAVAQVEAVGSCLVVVNTKAVAKRLLKACVGLTEVPVQHLSTSMCPAHRRQTLAELRTLLAAGKEVLCVSTQLIEAGVDVDFASAIRFLAGLDSIAQTAGRCNRHGTRPRGMLTLVNPAEENLQPLPDLRLGRDTCARVLDEFRADPVAFDGDLLGPRALERYFEYWFFQRQADMAYPLEPKQVGRTDTLLALLGCNDLALADYLRSAGGAPPAMPLRQSFRAAAEAFQVIEAPTQGVLVPYGEAGRDLVLALQASQDLRQEAALLARSQAYSVNVFPHEWARLQAAGALHETQPGSGIHVLDPRHYHPAFGLSTEPVSPMEVLHA
jgi:CRISPR-associated endonuclease/helicase Cas3